MRDSTVMLSVYKNMQYIDDPDTVVVGGPVSKDRLVVDEKNYCFYLTWYLADENDLGGSVGDTTYTELDLKPGMDRLDRDCVVAYLAAKDTAGVSVKTGMYSGGMWWDSKKDATAALRVVNAAIKADRAATPWPEWAKTAVANGWKAPKGWKP